MLILPHSRDGSKNLIRYINFTQLLSKFEGARTGFGAQKIGPQSRYRCPPVTSARAGIKKLDGTQDFACAEYGASGMLFLDELMFRGVCRADRFGRRLFCFSCVRSGW
jgi:hypothetical protein